MLDARVALLVAAVALWRSVLVRTVFARRRGAMVMHGAEADGYRCERTDRQERQHEKHDYGLELAAQAIAILAREFQRLVAERRLALPDSSPSRIGQSGRSSPWQ